MKKKIVALFLALMLVCSLAFSVTAVENDEATLSLQVSTGRGSVTVSVYLEGCAGVTNGRFTVGYDAEVLTLVEVKSSDVYAVDSINDSTAGSVSLAWVGSELTAEKTLMLTLVLEIAEGSNKDLTYTVAENGIFSNDGAVAVSGDSVTVVYDAPAVTTALENAIAVAQALNAEDYTEESFADLEAALEEAIRVLADVYTTQAEVDAAAAALNEAISALRPVGSADVTALKEAIAEAEALNKDLYTDVSYADVLAALESAKTVLADVYASQEDVDAAVQALNDAIAALELANPDTGSADGAKVTFWMVALVISLLAGVAVVVVMIRSGKGKQVCRFLCFVLVCCMLMSVIPVSSLAVVVGEDGVDTTLLSDIADLMTGNYVVQGEDKSFVGAIKEVFGKQLNLKTEQNISTLDAYYDDRDMVRVIVELEGEGLLEMGYTMSQISAYGEQVAADAARLEAVQDYVATQINQIVLKSSLSAVEVTVKYHYTATFNGLAVTVPYGTLEQIRNISGVENAYIASEYYAPESEESTDSPSMYATSESFGSAQTWYDLGYTGQGMVIAVIDTGLDVDHPSFADAPEGAGLTYEDVEAVLTELNAYQLFSQTSALALTADDLYYNEKIPFGFNYVDCGIDVTHDFDDMGDHGTHVAGIACANKLDTTSVVGVAPDAQVVVIKVFGQNGGAYSDDIIAGIEDCILLGVDVINMSLGSPAGFTEDSVLINEVYGRILENDMILAVAAGNIPSTASGNGLGTNLNFSSDPDIGIVNSPSTYLGATSVASSENHYVMMPYFAMGEEKIPFAIADYSTLVNFTDLAGEHEYVVVPGVGEESDYEGLDVTGKIVLVQRGTITFPQKEKNAYDHGAIAMICYDNVEGALVSMSPGGYIPGVFIAKKHGELLVEAAVDGVGTLTIQPYGEETPIRNGNGGQMSDFSAWGVTADLQLAPDVTAPGGNIYSCYTDGQYGTMSGTSMACPHIAGMSALILQYLHDVYPDLEASEYHTIAEALVMCTAEPATAPNGILYSARTQGAGFANVYNAVTSPVYLTSYQEATGEWTPKASMGDDPDRTGVFTFTFQMNNLTDTEQTYLLEGILMTDQYLTLEGWEDQEFFGEEGRYLSGDVAFSFLNSAVLTGYDFDGNGSSDMGDVQYVLDAANELFDAEADLNNDGITDTRDAQYLYEIVMNAVEEQRRITVPAGGSISVDVTIRLSAEDMAYINDHYENGSFVDGFIRAYAETEGAVDLSFPFMGFFGGWDEAPIFDCGWYYEDEDELIYNRYMHVIFATMGSDYNYGGLGMNPYFDEVYSSEHNVLSPNGDGYYDYVPEIYISLLRSAELLDFTWTDDASGDTLFYEYYTYARKGYYWNAYGMAMPIIYTDGGCQPFTFYDDNGELVVEDLQHLTLTIRGYLDDGELDDCYINDYGVPVPDTSWADGVIEIPVVIDLSAPKINTESIRYYTENGRNYVTFEVEDNYDIAAVVATTVGGGAYEYIPVTTKEPGVDGEKDTITLDITEYDATFQIVLCDYGCNESYYELSNVNCEGLTEDEFFAFRRYSTVETSSTIYTTDQLNGWYSFESADYMLQHTSQPNSGEKTVYAAEYVDGYIFGAQAGDNDYNTIFVMKSGSWDRIDLGTGQEMNKLLYEWPGEEKTYFPMKLIALDMAYDYSSGTMYMLCNALENTYMPDGEVNILCTLDLQTGAVTVLGKIFPDVAENAFLALTLACDDDGTLYTVNYEDGMLYTIDTEAVATTERYGYGTYLATCVDADGVADYHPAAYTQSMTIDHATGELYWAAYQGKTGQAAFINMDKETGEIKGMTYTVNNAEMVGLFRPWQSGNDEIADAALENITLRKSDLFLSVGDVTSIVTLPQPYNADLGTITYESLDESVAVVNEHGLVEAVGIGATVIEVTCTTDDAVIITECNVNVSNVNGTLFAYSGEHWLLMDSGTPGGASQVADAMELEGTVTASAFRDGYLYVAAVDEFFDEDYNLLYTTNLYKLDASTLQGELIASYSGNTTAYAYNYADGFMYGLVRNESYDWRGRQTISFDLIRVHLVTGQTKVVTNLDSIYPYSDRTNDYCWCSGALAIDYEGNFYINGDNADWVYNLVRFNLDENDAICNVTEFAGFAPYNEEGDSMVWSQRNGGILYASGETLYWLDVSDMENVQVISLGDVRGASGTVVALSIPVSNEPYVEGVIPTGMELEESYTMPEGESVRVLPTLDPWNAVGEYTYVIADESIARVDEEGYVTGLTIGTTTLMVTEVASGLTATTTIEVVKNPGYLYGYLQSYISQGVPMEVWARLPIANAENYNMLTDIYGLTIYAAAYYDGTVYACGQHSTDGKYYLMKISPSNFYYNVVEESNLMIRDMAFDYTTGTMYAVAYNEAVDGGLYQVDLDTMDLTFVGDNDLGVQLVTLACDDTGTLYASDSYGTVYAMNKHTVALTDTGISGGYSAYLQSMAYDYNNDAIYWAIGGTLFELNVDKGTISNIGTTECVVSGLFSVPRNAPEVPENTDPSGVAMAEKNTVAVGNTLQIEAVVLPVSVSNVDQTLIWVSSDETVATVDSNGVITGVSAGTCYITATDAKGNSASIFITVTAGQRFFYGYDELSNSWVQFGSDGVILNTWADDESLSPIVAAQFIDGVLYAYDQDGFFYTIDLETFQRTLMGDGINGKTTSLQAWDKTHDEQVYYVDGIPYQMIDLTYSTENGETKLYGVMMAWNISLWRDSYSYIIAEMNMQTGRISSVILQDSLVDGMSLRPTNLLYRAGHLWTINGYITGMIVKVDPNDGYHLGTAICPEYWGDFNGGRSMLEDPLTGTVYAIRDMRTPYIGGEDYSDAYSTSVLCTMELGIGRVDEVCTIGTNMRIVGLFIH